MISRLVLISIFILNSIAFSQTKSTQLDLDNLTPQQLALGQQLIDQSSKDRDIDETSVVNLETEVENNARQPIDKSDPSTTDENNWSPLEKGFNQVDIYHNIQTKIPTLESSKKPAIELKQFGYDFFHYQRIQSRNIDVPMSYQLQKGDIFTLFIYGKKEQVLELLIDNEGDVFIPNIGPVLVAGLSVNEANEKIRIQLKRKYVNFNSEIKLNSTRKVMVLISGNIHRPGSYSVSKYESIFSVLSQVNGIKKSGSLRKIKLLKSDGKKVSIDLYDYLLKGGAQEVISFSEGDVLFIPAITESVAISGAVNKPGIYEIKDGETLGDVLNFASGRSLNAYKNTLYINRFDNRFQRKVVSVSTNTNKKMQAKLASQRVFNGDVIFIPEKPMESYGYVSIMGNVNVPSQFEFKKGMSLADVISLAQGEKLNSHSEAHVFRYMSENNRQLISVPINDAAFKLHDRDVVTIYNQDELKVTESVAIIGEVLNPGEYHYFKGMSVNDLIVLSGLKQFASLTSVEIARFNGVKSELFYAKSNQLTSFKLEPGDRISIKKDNLRDQTATIELKGEFVFPGVYKVNKGTKLADIIKRAGGYTDSAYLKAAVFLRKSVQNDDETGQQKVIEDEKKRFIYDQSHLGNLLVDSKVSMGIMMTARQEALQFLETKSGASSGRVIIDLYKDNFQLSKDNFIVQDGDVLNVPTMPESIHIIGGVQQGVSMAYNPNYSLYDYIENVGGFTKYADKGNIYVFKSSGRVFKNHSDIEPGDIVYVPEKVVISFNWLQFLTSITQIVSNAVTSIALVRSIQ